MNSLDINDIRTIKDFRGITFSKYKTKDVKLKFINELKNENLLEAYYWFSELFTSGNTFVIWECIFHFTTMYINTANPKIFVYLQLKTDEFIKIYNFGYINQELFLRNNSKCRNLFCEIISILCASPKKPGFQNLKIVKNTDFIIQNIKHRLKAPNTDFINNIFQVDDPDELFLACNEFSYAIHISNNHKNQLDAIYWLEWMLSFEKQFQTQHKKSMKAAHRNIKSIPSISQYDIIWIIWDIILASSSTETTNQILNKIISSLFNLFSFHFKPGHKTKHKPLIYIAIIFIIEYKNINFTTPILDNQALISPDYLTTVKNQVFSSLKQHEISPNTDYLFDENTSKTETEKTFGKLNKLADILGTNQP